MLFNSLAFAIFFVIVYGLYLVSTHQLQNRILLAASYYFYAAWSWKLTSLLLISTTIDYFCALGIEKYRENQKAKKRFLALSLMGNLGMLGFFKYYNFFISNLEGLIGSFGGTPQFWHLDIILPVGISFYTFQTLSYTIDVYKGQMKPTRDFFDFALYVSFFPQLVAGPIERASRLLPQIAAKRHITPHDVRDGCYLVFWGLFQKMFVADNLGKFIGRVVHDQSAQNGLSIMLALYAGFIQVCCDFGGYSNIARGLAKLMGFELMVNFNLPFFVKNAGEFWRRWHISLSTWIRDYVYFPLGGSRRGELMTYRNLLVIMLLVGIWHGAGWNYVLWGLFQGCIIVSYRIMKPTLDRMPVIKNRFWAGVWTVVRMVFFFNLISLTGVCFFEHSIPHVVGLCRDLVFNMDFSNLKPVWADLKYLVFYSWLLLGIQAVQYIKNDTMIIARSRFWVQAVFYVVLFYFMFLYGNTGGEEFMYFQF